ncbi:MAG: hypothetical protein QM650_14050 [Microlunatus sp.]
MAATVQNRKTGRTPPNPRSRTWAKHRRSAPRVTIDAIDASIEGGWRMVTTKVRRPARSKTTRRSAGELGNKPSRSRSARRVVEAKLRLRRISYVDFSDGLTRAGIRVNLALLETLAHGPDQTLDDFVRIAKKTINPAKSPKTQRADRRPEPGEVTRRVRERIMPLVDDGTLSRPEAEAALQAIAERLPDHDDPTEMLGPYYDTSGLRQRLGVTRQALAGRVQRDTLLGVEADDGSILYPVWQFDHHLKVLAGLPAILQELNQVATDGFSKALWLCTPQDDLNQKTSAEWLAESGDAERVRHLAEADVARMLV